MNIFKLKASHSEALQLCQGMNGIMPFPVNESDFQRRFHPSLNVKLWMPLVRSKGHEIQKKKQVDDQCDNIL